MAKYVMRAIERADAAVLAAHQWLVNVSGKQPAWCVEQCAYAFAVGGLGSMASSGAPLTGLVAVWSLLLLLASAGIFAISRSPRQMARLASDSFFRRVMLAFVVSTSWADIFRDWPVVWWVFDLILMFGLVGAEYFPGCLPPPPRPPKRAPVPAGGGA